MVIRKFGTFSSGYTANTCVSRRLHHWVEDPWTTLTQVPFSIFQHFPNTVTQSLICRDWVHWPWSVGTLVFHSAGQLQSPHSSPWRRCTSSCHPPMHTPLSQLCKWHRDSVSCPGCWFSTSFFPQHIQQLLFLHHGRLIGGGHQAVKATGAASYEQKRMKK